jgi:hypothetical protein
MKIAVALLTCDRVDYTARTLQSFRACNPDVSRFVLLHGDDGSVSDENHALARAHGFQTVVQARSRMGWRVTRPALLETAAYLSPWILLLENDIESVRPFPWTLFDFVRKHPQIYCLRLYGRFKDAAKTELCLSTHKREGHTPVEWRPLRNGPEMSQVGRIHWSAQPCVTRSRELLSLHRTGHEPTGYTARVKKNVMSHFGSQRTAPLQMQEVA